MTIGILIVDDNQADRYLLRRVLKSTSFDLHTEESIDGADALKFFEDYHAKRLADPETFPPLIIFLDINMPRVNGFEFLEGFDVLQRELALLSTVVVMFSSSPRQDDRDRAFQWPFVKDYMVKGEFTGGDLEQLIDEVVNADPAGSTPPTSLA